MFLTIFLIFLITSCKAFKFLKFFYKRLPSFCLKKQSANLPFGFLFFFLENVEWIGNKKCHVFWVGHGRTFSLQKQSSRGGLIKRCSENMQQICRITPMPKCDINKTALQLYWNHTSAWLFSCDFAAYFQNTFSSEHPWRAVSVSS